MPHKRLVLLAALGIAIAADAAPAVAATLTVNTPIDAVSPGAGECSLREAVQAIDSPGTANGDCAPASFGANTVRLGRGHYYLTAPNGELNVSSVVTSLTIIGAGEGETVIDATGLRDRILEVQAGASVSVSNLTMTGGRAPAGASGQYALTGAGSGQAGGNGGAILNAGSLTLTDAAITSSVSGQGGDGAGPVPAAVGNPGLPGGAGGRGGQGGAIFNSGNLTLTGVTIAGNQTGPGGNGGQGEQGAPTGGNGGAGGASGAGGGIASAGGNVTITATTIRANKVGAGGSGGVGGAYPAYLNSAPVGGGAGGTGAAGADGGGVWNDGGALSVTNSTFVSNVAGAGGAGGAGGVGAGAGANGGNGGSGGAIAATAGASSKLVNVTVVGNSSGAGGAAGTGGPANGPAGVAGGSGDGGGIAGEGAHPVSVQNGLLALNLGGNCATGTVIDAGHNLSFRDASCPSSFGSGDPNLGPLQDNGGPTATISLGPGSAALDQIPTGGAGCPAADQRGVLRPSGSACDIGAYELAPPMVKAGTIKARTARRVEIRALVTADSGVATVWVKYGRTKSYGRRSGVKQVGGVTPVSVSLDLSSLNPSAIYHYRIVASTVGGKVESADMRLVRRCAARVGHRGGRTCRWVATGATAAADFKAADK